MSEEYKPRCMYLSCKAMMVHGEDFEQDPEYQEGEVDFWCNCTGKGSGPDGQMVALEQCQDAERECFKEY